MSATERQLRDEIDELGEQIERDQEAYAALRHDRDRVQLLADARQRKLEAENARIGEEHRAFVDGLTEALNAHGVPAMPSWRDAIDYLAAHGGTS